MKVYVASSWKSSERHQEVVNALRDNNIEVYDYRTDGAFHWSEIHPNYRNWDTKDFLEGLEHPLAKKAFKLDLKGMTTSDACILILPSGRSSHMEAGWFVGQGKPLYILTQDGEPPELTYKLADLVTVNFAEILGKLK